MRTTITFRGIEFDVDYDVPAEKLMKVNSMFSDYASISSEINDVFNKHIKDVFNKHVDQKVKIALANQ